MKDAYRGKKGKVRSRGMKMIRKSEKKRSRTRRKRKFRGW